MTPQEIADLKARMRRQADRLTRSNDELVRRLELVARAQLAVEQALQITADLALKALLGSAAAALAEALDPE